jgi:hypothetical protein
MTAKDRTRKVSAWILTLPGPWSGETHCDALKAAADAFEPGLSPQAFEAELAAMGYALRQTQQGFVLCPQAQPPARRMDPLERLALDAAA